jgi:hypothetical protein
MGVGVYSSNFNGTGGTFILDGLVGGEEEYGKYVKENVSADAPSYEEWHRTYAEYPDATEDDYEEWLQENHAEDSVSFETWQEDQVSSHVDAFEQTIRTAAREMAFEPIGNYRGRYSRASFDDDFVIAASGRFIEIGWRSWEHDYIIGVGGDSTGLQWAADPDGCAGEIIDETGLAPSTFAKIYGSLTDAIQDYVRLSLMRDGHECRFRTSGYTSGIYEAPAMGFDAALDLLRNEIVDLQQRIPVSFRDGVVNASADEREEIVRSVVMGKTNTPALVPLFDPEAGEMRIYRPDRRRFVDRDTLPPDFAGYVEAAAALGGGSGDFIEVPRSGDLAEAWAALQSRYPDELIVSAQEWVDAYGEDLLVEWTDDAGQEWQAEVVKAASEALPAP